jgi:isopenicillin-N N-acyltransferase like protein
VSAEIPLLRVSGSHAEVGRQIGDATAATIRRLAAGPFDVALVEAYRSVASEHLPWAVEEIDAVAEAAGVDPLAAFAASVEELAGTPAATGCTDLVALGEASADGHVLVAHNNDLDAADEEDLVAIEWRVDGEATLFTLGNGCWLSVGWNDAGLSVTGNELTPNDERIGVPRLLQMRDAVRQRTLAGALESILHPARASSYNWVLAHASGEALNVEGSATAAGESTPENGTLTHANHYEHRRMTAFEGRARTDDSASRSCRAADLLAAREGPVTTDDLRAMLADHEHAPDSLCRHTDADNVKTVFWCVADVTAGEIAYGRGNPCSSTTQTYGFRA